MATFTEHYDLIKPGTDDYFDIADFSENMDAIDTQLYQAEVDMAGVSEKIGNPGDEGEDTLFGLLNPGSQPEEKADFYHYSTTEIKKQIQNWKVSLGGESTFYAKLTNFQAEKNGTIYVKFQTQNDGHPRFIIYDKAPLSVVNCPDKTNLGRTPTTGWNPDEPNWYYVNYTGTQILELVMPVLAGITYTFLWYGSSVSNAQVNEFAIGYTDTKET